MRTLWLLVAALPLYGQHLSFGITGGGTGTGGLDPSAQDKSEGKRYVVGLTSEVKLPLPHVSLQVDVLFRHAGANHADCAFTSCVYSETRANIFEFPVLARYGLRRPAAAAPFVEAGLAYQWVRHAYGGALSWRTGPIVPGEVVDLSVHRGSVSMPAENHLGFVAGGGVEFRSGRFRVAPEIRYTRWNARYWEVFGARGFFTGSNLNQIDGLVGVGF